MMLSGYDPRDEQRFLRMGRFEPAEQTCALWWKGFRFNAYFSSVHCIIVIG